MNINIQETKTPLTEALTPLDSTLSIERRLIPTYQGLAPEVNAQFPIAKLKSLIPIEKIGISETSCHLLRTVAESNRLSSNNSIINNLVYYAHKQFILLKNANGHFRVETLNTLIDHLFKKINLLSVFSINNSALELYKQKMIIPEFMLTYFNFIFDSEITGLKNIEKGYKFILNSDQLHNAYTLKVKNKSLFFKIKNQNLTHFNNIMQTFQCIEEILQLPADKKNAFLNDEIATKVKWPYPLKEAPSMEVELVSYKDFIFQIVSTNKQFELVPSFVDTNEVNDFFNTLADVLKDNSHKEEIFFEKVSLHKKSLDLINDLTKQKCDTLNKELMNYEEFKKITPKPLSEHDFKILHFQSMVSCQALQNTLNNVSLSVSEKLNDRLILSKIACLQLEISSYYLKQFIGNRFIKDSCDDVIDALDYDSVNLINEFLDKIIKLENMINHDNGHLITSLVELLEVTNIDYLKYKSIKNLFNDFIIEVTACKNLMQDCNSALQKFIDESDYDLLHLNFLDESLNLFNEKISFFLSSAFDAPDLLNNLIVFKTKKVNILNTDGIEINLNMNKNLFNINFETAYEKRAKPFFSIEENKIPQTALAKPKEEAKREAPIDLPENKLKSLLAYLKLRKWVCVSKNGSHFKFRCENQTLIVPTNKKNLKSGTFHAILKQEQMKNSFS